MQTQELYNYEIDLKEIFNVLWLDKKFIIQISAIFTIGSLLFSLSLTNYYKSESLLLARDASESQGAFSQISSMASLAGVSLPTSGNNKALQAVELIKSRKFVNHLLTFEEILPSIMAAKTYSHSTQQLLFDQKQYDPKTKKWKRKPGKNRQITPTYIEAHREYREMLSIKILEIRQFVRSMM